MIGERVKRRVPRCVYVGGEGDEVSITADQVVEDDLETFTGLYDIHGNEIHRLPERVPLGFVK